MCELDGRVALVTGAAGSGIGRATARRLLDEGATVVVTDVHERRLAETTRELVDAFGAERVVTAELDAGDRAQIDRVIAKGGRLSMAELLRCRVRYFTDGVALGSKSFVSGVLSSGRDPTEVSGADLGGLAVASRLRNAAICAPG